MSKWEEYQDFSTAAAKAGGVLRHLAKIEKNAVDAARPAFLAKGGAAGAALATAVILGDRRHFDKRKADQAAADEAKKQLVAGLEKDGKVEPELGPEGSQVETTTDPGSNND